MRKWDSSHCVGAGEAKDRVLLRASTAWHVAYTLPQNPVTTYVQGGHSHFGRQKTEAARVGSSDMNLSRSSHPA